MGRIRTLIAISFWQQWYAAQVTMLCSWLSERLDHNLHPYQCTCLAHIVKVSSWFQEKSWQTVSIFFLLVINVPKYLLCICQFLLLCWLRLLHRFVWFMSHTFLIRKFLVLGNQTFYFHWEWTEMHFLDQKFLLFVCQFSMKIFAMGKNIIF